MPQAPHNSASRDLLDVRVLDALRGLTAAYVVLFHATQILLPASATELTSAPGDVAAWWQALMGYGHVAVLLFFLISGFCIHYARATAASQGIAHAFAPRRFALRRLRRLYPVLLLALVLTVACDTLGATLSPTLYAGTGAPAYLTAQLGGGSLSLATLVGNMLFQGGLSSPVFGSNVPLWSLAYEFWFYALYPVLLLLSRRFGSARTLAIVAAVSVLAALPSRFPIPVVPWWTTDVLAHWVTWVAGAAIAEMYARRERLAGRRWALWSGGLAIGAAMLANPGPQGNITNLGWGLALAGLLAGTMLGSPSTTIGRVLESMARRLAPLGAISYSLYALHFPLLVLVLAWWQSTHVSPPVGPGLMIGGSLGAMAFAACVWHLFERHFVSPRPKALAARPLGPATSPSLGALHGQRLLH